MSVLRHIAQFFSTDRPGQTLRVPARLWMHTRRTDFTARPDLPREKELQWWGNEVGLIVTTQYANDEPFEFLVCEKPRPAVEPPPVEPSAAADTSPCSPDTMPAALAPAFLRVALAPVGNCSPQDHDAPPDATAPDTSDTRLDPQTQDEF